MATAGFEVKISKVLKGSVYMENGFVALHRKILNWEWYSDANVIRLFLHCLLMANWENRKHKGTEIPRGSFATSRDKLVFELQLTDQQIRTALKKLKSTNEITTTPTNKGTIINVVNYGFYQDLESESTNRITSKSTDNQPANQPAINQQINQQITTNEQYNNKTIKDIKDILSDSDESTTHKKPQTESEPENQKEQKLDYQVHNVIGYLNEKSGKSFRASTKKTVSLIRARLKDGYTLDDFKSVIDCKCAKWLDNPEFVDYLRPETLFAESKFENYLQESKIKRIEKRPQVKKNSFNSYDQRDFNVNELEATLLATNS